MTDSSPQYEAQLMRKLTWKVVPFLCLCFMAAFLDRVNVGFAKEQMQKDLNMDAQVYSLGAGIFFVGYFLFEVPSNLILAKVGARSWIARIMITWSIISASFAFVQSETAFYVLRFLLGAAEAGFFPGVIYYLTKWFPSAYRSRTIALFMMAAAGTGIIGAPLSGLLLDLDGVAGLRGYKWLFLVEALPSLVLGIILFLRLPNGPEEAKWLDAGEKKWLNERLEQDRIAAGPSAHTSFAQALTDPRVLVLCFVYFTHVLVGYGLDFFLPTLIKGSFKDASSFVVGCITGIPAVFAIIIMGPYGRSSDRRAERKWHYALAVWWAAIGLVVASFSPPAALSVIALGFVVAGRWSAVAPFWGLATTFLSGSAAAGSIALINAVGNLGGVCGPYIMGWSEKHLGSHDWGMRLLALLVFFGGLIATFIKVKPAVVGKPLSTEAQIAEVQS
ncbi:MAG: transporter [Polyangiaceae bacterium]|jgi:ACS family tartrate transporter-like MFS transporter|nr:transporter [Polyangiaceae bacterium]